METTEWTASLISGAVAGLAVDISLFPVDTVKTRLQTKHGFLKSGGFRNLYTGIGPVVLGSAPGAAVFFTVYETAKTVFKQENQSKMATSFNSMFAACVGETAACGVRVPVELIKQRAQVGGGKGTFKIFVDILLSEGPFGMYRGYRSTVLREIPFSLVQFPIWEVLKKLAASPSEHTTPLQSALCGFISGGLAAAVTTPLDVAKTRIMLASKEETAASGKIFPVLLNIYRNEGIHALFLGVKPRVILISVGGFVFLGTYDLVKSFFTIK